MSTPAPAAKPSNNALRTVNAAVTTSTGIAASPAAVKKHKKHHHKAHAITATPVNKGA